MGFDGPFPFANPAVLAGAIAEIADVPYTGNDANDRVVDIGIAADLVLIFAADSQAEGIDHLAIAWAWGSLFGVFGNKTGTPNAVYHRANAAAASGFQGITGTTIKLGSTGSQNIGTNRTGRLYRVLAFRFN